MSSGSKKSVPETPTEKSTLQDPIVFYKQRTGQYPSNSEIWWSYRRPLELGTQEPPKNYLEVFDPSLRHQVSTGNSPAPKGHYVLDAFHLDRSYVSGVAGLPVVSSGGYRPSAVAFYAGRVFYAGVNVSQFNTKIYFTQVLERPDQVQNAHQQLDPTNEDLRDLLPTDGGIIVVPEVTEVYHMVPLGDSLFVFARNGVWQISGSEGLGFKANDYSVNKISGVPAISNLSFVIVEGAPLWWNRSGIWNLSLDQRGVGSVQSLTKDTIQQFFDKIPVNSKFYAKGAYDPLTDKVQWLYRSTEAETDADNFKYDKILVLDTRTGAFYPYNLPSTRVDMKGIFDVEGFSVSQEVNLVFDGDDQVFVGTDEVLYLQDLRKAVQSKIKYVVNVLDDTEDVPEPPEPLPQIGVAVFVNDDSVLVNTDEVIIYT